ncbi:MAG: iron-containing alcohol dehydrogenase [Clostridiales bacterium]|nr:iron-containing alcohol dehydrogenase [Clostridiales bacterium]MDY5976013.1 iron-containing alcohol dehydrogenase [Anaerovoracaceae bacterium]
MVNWLRLPKKVYFKRGSTPVALRELSEVYGMKRAFLISDSNDFNKGITRPIEALLKAQGIRYASFSSFDSEFTYDDAYNALAKMESLKPDVIIGIGSVSAMSMARLMAMLLDNPETDLEAEAAKHSAITEVVSDCPGSTDKLVLVPSINYAATLPVVSAIGKDGKRTAMLDFAALPFMAVIDPETDDQLTADELKKNASDILALAEKVKADPETSEYVIGFAEDAVRIVNDNLPLIENGDESARRAIENLANAAAIAGAAAANAGIDSQDILKLY